MILDADGNPFPRKKYNVDAAYDVLNKKHIGDQWSFVNSLNANATDTKETRRSLRDLCRYEKRNNPHLSGLIQKITNEIVGTGPRLSIEPKTPSERSLRAARRVETDWNESCEEMKFIEKLRTMVTERPTGGEVFTQVVPNRVLSVPVDLAVLEADMIETPGWDRDGQTPDGPVDGIYFDQWGNITSYSRLDYHPHGNAWRYTESATLVSSDYMFHWFNKDRPSRYRGIPEVAATLEIYGRLRRFLESKVIQEELRAKLTGIVSTGFAPAECADIGDDPIQMLIGDGQFLTMPDGWTAEAFKFDITGQGVMEFVRTCLSWATQALLVPWNITAGDSSDYNFASGRLDYMLFYHFVAIVRKELERRYLCWFFDKHWFPMYQLVKSTASSLGEFDCVWYWDQREPIDKAKAANAVVTLKDGELLDEPKYWQEQGENPLEVKKRQIRFELESQKYRQDMMEELGLEEPTQETPENP